MPTSPAQQLKLDNRRARIAQLYSLGLTQSQIAEILEVSHGTISNDLKWMTANEVLTEVDRGIHESYNVRFAHYARMKTEQAAAQRWPTDYGRPTTAKPFTQSEVLAILHRTLQIETIMDRLGRNEEIAHWILVPLDLKPEWCARFLKAVYRNTLPNLLREAWIAYLGQVVAKTAPTPISSNVTYGATVRILVRLARTNVLADWPIESRVEEIVLEAIDALPPREASVLRTYFRDGVSLTTIAHDIGVSPSRPQQIKNDALRRLRAEGKRSTLTTLWMPTSLRYEDTHDIRQQLAATVDGAIETLQAAGFVVLTPEQAAAIERIPVGGPLAIDVLCWRISQLGLDVWCENRLQNGYIKYVYELVQKSPAELFKIKNFGKKSLWKVQEALRELGLSLNMPSNNVDVEAARIRCSDRT